MIPVLGFAPRALCWGVLRGTALIWREEKVVGMEKKGLFFGKGGFFWKFYTQIPRAGHEEGFYTDDSGQQQQQVGRKGRAVS